MTQDHDAYCERQDWMRSLFIQTWLVADHFESIGKPETAKRFWECASVISAEIGKEMREEALTFVEPTP